MVISVMSDHGAVTWLWYHKLDFDMVLKLDIIFITFAFMVMGYSYIGDICMMNYITMWYVPLGA